VDSAAFFEGIIVGLALEPAGPRFLRTYCRIALTAREDAVCAAWLDRWSMRGRPAVIGRSFGEPDQLAKLDRLDN
jgi:hypothetical protein